MSATFYAAVLVSTVAIQVRNYLTFKHRRRAIRLYWKRDWRTAPDIWEASPGYLMMMFDLTKWTFSQFYPDLSEDA